MSRKLFLIVIIFSFQRVIQAQNSPENFKSLINRADSLYNVKDYKNSTATYTNAFSLNNWKAPIEIRYNAACSWALFNKPDSAFYQLYRIAELGNYSDYDRIASDQDLLSIQGDPRWITLLEIVKKNKERSEANLNKELVSELDSIYFDDQKYRLRIGEISQKFGQNSSEFNSLMKTISIKDSLNLAKVCAIIDQYGWLGPEVIGVRGNSTLFLVIQHSDLSTQEKYLPILKQAAKDGKAAPASLALLEDRVALGQGKRQIYGSQVGFDSENKSYYLLPLWILTMLTRGVPKLGCSRWRSI